MTAASPVSIRDATLEDVGRIVRYNAAMAEETEGILPDATTLREGVRALVQDPGKGRYFVAELDGRAVGQTMITYEWSDWRNGTYVWLQSVYVEPEFRRQGIFRALYEHVQRLAEEPGYVGIRLYVHHSNEGARQTYLRLGMTAGEYDVFETTDPLKLPPPPTT